MVNLRVQAEADLAITLEGDFALPIELTDPDGAVETLQGRIDYDTIVASPDTGVETIIKHPVVTLRRSSMNSIPIAGAKWGVRIPITPDPDAELKTFAISSDRASEGGATIGYIRLYLQDMEQAT